MAQENGTLGDGTDPVAGTARLVAALRDARRLDGADGPADLIETHVSYVLLTGRLAYKIKKPLRLAFLDFSTLERRLEACEEELRLNRRTAPELYLRVVPITGSIENPVLGGQGPAIEYAVEMRQFDPDSLAARCVETGRVDGGLVDRLADRVAEFHARLVGTGPVAPALESAAAVDDSAPPAIGSALAIARRNVAEIREARLPAALQARIDRVADWLDRTGGRLAAHLAARAEQGFVRDAHGDLHLANVAIVGGEPVLFDCLEFDRALRQIDVVDEIAFAFMDFLALGRRDLGYRFVNRYLEQTGDYEGAVALPFFAVHRALVRSKVASIRRRQKALDEASSRSLDAAVERPLAVAESLASAPRPLLAITCGLAGTGKTTVSSALLEEIPAIRIRSDVERKRLAGLAAAARSESPIEGGLYARAESARLYERLGDLARGLLASGQSVIVDAAFLVRSERARFRQIARAGGFGFRTILCDAPIAILRARVAERARAGRDASEADVPVLDHQLTRYEAPSQDEASDLVVLATDRPIERVEESARLLARSFVER